MSQPFVKFNQNNQPKFYEEVLEKVNQYFKENEISKHANGMMYFKTAFMLVLYTLPLVFMLLGFVTNFWVMMLMWGLMGFGMSGIGLSIMHDANHGAYSNKKRTNKIFGFLLNYIGGYHINWKIQHNVLHHSFTNVEGCDEDIDKPVMRFSPNQKNKAFFYIQAFYATFFYAILTIYWLVAKDYVQLVKFNKMKLLKGQKVTFAKALFQILFNKAWYLTLTLVLPILFMDFPWWQVLIGFLTMQVISGLILAFIFQPAHVINETEFYEVDKDGGVENSWAMHQMYTTANFANNSGFFSWFIGGLNYQIEHHLFPNVCHVHYKKMAPIVKEVALKHNLPYHYHRTFVGALKSHFSMLNRLGKDTYVAPTR